MSQIEWTDKTWNPITGCSKISPGCANCYAASIARRFWGDRRFEDVRFHENRLLQPLSWRKPQKVFVNSMSDLFHPLVTDDQIYKILAVAAVSSRHTFQILTKRPDRMASVFLPKNRKNVAMNAALLADSKGLNWKWAWPLPNVWLGVSLENQAAVTRRAGALQTLREAGWRVFYSCEPLLEDIDLHLDESPVDWVIVGGESGPGARECDTRWISGIVRQCQEANTPVFVKQFGSNAVYDGRRLESSSLNNRLTVGMPMKGLFVREWPNEE